ncbi:hypothetical protein BC835DRAFT_1273134, partial [Cytidiella melzeri]
HRLVTAMAPEVKFTSFGIPYLVEFANVTFRRRKRNTAYQRQPATLYSMPHCDDSDWTFASLSSRSEKGAYAVIESEDENEEEGEPGEGLWIRFASQANTTYHSFPLSQSRLTRLKHRIAKAVVAAGMESGQNMQPSDPFETALRTQGVVPPAPVSSFYRGTYGQVMEALQSAGLVVSQCEESGFEGATFLGALFVGRQTRSGGVELAKLSLWA